MQAMKEAALGAWPLSAVRLRTDRLVLAPVADDQIDELVELAGAGVHPSALQPFGNGWTDREGSDFEQQFAQYFWRQRASWSPNDWALPFAVSYGDELIGVQQIQARAFSVLRTVSTGSWIGRRYQGRGFGTEMRAAVLALAFEHLQAEEAVSGAYHYNSASRRVSEKLGYRRNGTRRDVVRGANVEAILYRLTRDEWFDQPRSRVTVHGLVECMTFFVAP